MNLCGLIYQLTAFTYVRICEGVGEVCSQTALKQNAERHAWRASAVHLKYKGS